MKLPTWYLIHDMTHPSLLPNSPSVPLFLDNSTLRILIWHSLPDPPPYTSYMTLTLWNSLCATSSLPFPLKLSSHPSSSSFFLLPWNCLPWDPSTNISLALSPLHCLTVPPSLTAIIHLPLALSEHYLPGQTCDHLHLLLELCQGGELWTLLREAGHMEDSR